MSRKVNRTKRAKNVEKLEVREIGKTPGSEPFVVAAEGNEKRVDMSPPQEVETEQSTISCLAPQPTKKMSDMASLFRTDSLHTGSHEHEISWSTIPKEYVTTQDRRSFSMETVEPIATSYAMQETVFIGSPGAHEWIAAEREGLCGITACKPENIEPEDRPDSAKQEATFDPEVGLKPGDIVRVIDIGQVYTGYEQMARKLRATKWTSYNSGDCPLKNSAIALVVSTHCQAASKVSPAIVYVLIDIGGQEFVIGRDGLVLVDSAREKKEEGPALSHTDIQSWW